MMKNKKQGKVFLVGGGPGDPELITVKGIRILNMADVIIYDYLVSDELIKNLKLSTELIYVGKKAGDHILSQEKINELIVKKAINGKIVARLKGGDPFIFGRGGEEIEALLKYFIPFEVIPGITSASAAAAYAGIPLSHRKYTAKISFVTGHEDPKKIKSNINWVSLAKSDETIVFFMGVKNLKFIVNNLILNGKSIKTPVAVIRWGTTEKQFTVVGDLNNILKKCFEMRVKPPAVIVIGKVVKLRKKMRWFDNRPLSGKSIMITRARAQASNLIARLRDFGAKCIECPTIEIVPPIDWKKLDNAFHNINFYDWLIFTSVNGVKYFFKRLFKNNKDVRILSNIKIMSIGPATDNELRCYGLKSDFIPVTYCAESIVDIFKKMDCSGEKICLARAEKARDVIPNELRKMGHVVDDISVYRTISSCENVDKIVNMLENRKIDMVTFTSSSTVENFNKIFEIEKMSNLIKDVSIACIGPVTAKTALKFGMKIDIVSEEYTINGLSNSILNYYK